MIGVLLINMGSPRSKKEMRSFLFRMFCDSAILPFAKLPRTLLALIISVFRSPGSWKKYEQIGGSKLMESMSLISEQLSVALGDDFHVSCAYSYSRPSIADGVRALYAKGIREIRVVTMYPHSAFSTTGSVKTDLTRLQYRYPDLQITMSEAYGDKQLFVSYWAELIQQSMTKNNFRQPTLVFSAHAIPQYNVEAGDTYVNEIQVSAQCIAGQLKLDYRVAFQSKIGRVKWVGPDTKDCLWTFNAEEILLVPISFLNENLETAYDLDMEIIPFAQNVVGIQKIARVEIPASHPNLIELFSKIIHM